MDIDKLEGEALAEAICQARDIELLKDPRVFGEELPDHETYYVYHNTYHNTRRVRRVDPHGDYDYCPYKDIAQAWELMEEMDAGGKYVELHNHYTPGQEWCCLVNPLGTNGAGAIGTTAPVAICRAFLKAKAAQ